MTTYYVETAANGGNDGNAGDEAHPWLTIQHAADTMSAGDTVLVGGGTYAETVVMTTTGTSGNVITFQNQTDETPIIDGTGINVDDGLFEIKDCSYITLDGFTIQDVDDTWGDGVSAYGEAGDISNIVLKNLIIKDTRCCAIDVGSYQQSKGHKVSNLTIDNVEATGCNYKGAGSGENIDLGWVENFEVKNCYLHDNGQESIAMDSGCSTGSIHDNEVDGSTLVGIYVNGAGYAQDGINIYNNLVHDSSSGGISINNEIDADAQTNINVYNNIIYNCGYYDFGCGGTFAKTFTFINNTLYDDGCTSGMLYLNGASGYTSCYVRNNIVCSTDTTSAFLCYCNSYDSIDLTIDYTIWYAPGTYHPSNEYGEDYIIANPLLTSPTSDFTIPYNSPAHDAGSSSLAPADDYAGTTRPQGQGVDIGAYEILEETIMSLDTQTLLSLIEELARSLGHYETAETTTNITTSNAVISTTLQQFDENRDGYFDGWWCYLPDGENAGTERITGLPGTTTYATATGGLTVDGAALSEESGAVTIELFKYKRDNYKRAILEAVKKCYPNLHLDIDNQSLSTGNVLPDGHLDEWSSSSTLAHWTASDATLLRTSTAGYFRGGTYSCKLSASDTDGHIYVSSNDYPQLLELQGQSVHAYAWAYPQTLDDPTIIIDTVSRDGSTTQTLESTTSCPAGYWTLIDFEPTEALDDDLQEVKLTLNVSTSGQYCYFDDVWLGSQRLIEYLLPSDFKNGKIYKAYVQTKGYEDPIMYDLRPFFDHEGEEFVPDIITRGTYKYIQTPLYPLKRRFRFIGIKPLETMSDDDDTVTLRNEQVPILIKKAQEVFWEREAQHQRGTDRDMCVEEQYKASREYNTLISTMSMSTPREKIKRWK